jgi:hypothetical protein
MDFMPVELVACSCQVRCRFVSGLLCAGLGKQLRLFVKQEISEFGAATLDVAQSLFVFQASHWIRPLSHEPISIGTPVKRDSNSFFRAVAF